MNEDAGRENFAAELLRFGLIALLVVVPVRLFIAQPFVVSGASMEPTFDGGEYLIVDEVTYRLKAPERGDVVIFRFPEDTSKYFIKRIVGLPGETVSISDGAVRVTNREHPDGIALAEPYVERNSVVNNIPPTILKDGEYFVLGDNRRESLDSRFWGPLGEEFIVGRALLRLVPITELGYLPGKTSY